MQPVNNLIQTDAKTLVSERFFDNEAVRTAQTVVALKDVQATNYVSEVVVQTPRVTLRPARRNGHSLAYILLSIFALGTAAAAFYFLPSRSQSSATEVSQSADEDNIDDSVKPKIIASQKPVEPPPNRKASNSAPVEKNKSVKETERSARQTPPLTPDETEPGQWKIEEADVADEETPKPKTKKREKKADNDLDDFVREVENVERQTRRIKKVLDEFGKD